MSGCMSWAPNYWLGQSANWFPGESSYRTSASAQAKLPEIPGIIDHFKITFGTSEPWWMLYCQAASWICTEPVLWIQSSVVVTIGHPSGLNAGSLKTVWDVPSAFALDGGIPSQQSHWICAGHPHSTSKIMASLRIPQKPWKSSCTTRKQWL